MSTKKPGKPSKRYICIHGHFYQPPRENPWLERIDVQDSALPYHDWNERITEECYAANAASRILDREGKVIGIVNNYGNISFNFGPTLLAWVEKHRPALYAEILSADEISRTRFSGHGSAMAQPFNHVILPLANRRDKLTQVIWGIADFKRRFQRAPEGAWLPEAAVDLETLELLAQNDIKFTVLSPYQAARMRPISGAAALEPWVDATGGNIDPTTPYLQRLPSGRKIVIFFYDGPISRGAAFEGILRNGEDFANRLMGAFVDSRKHVELVHMATDGETYGHHHRFGDMALAYAIHHIDSNSLAHITNYAEFLSLHPPIYETEIQENTSWSCAHGVDRWKANCGCNSGGHPGWSQEWRKPLREAFDWLRDWLAPRYEKEMQKFVKDPWFARNCYIDVVLDRSQQNVDAFLAKMCGRQLDAEEYALLLKLLEMQRNAMLMYTSCGWFFDEVSGIETVQCIQYSGRVIQLAESVFDDAAALESEFLVRLALVPSNVKEIENAARVYELYVKPAVVDFLKVGAHYAVNSLFDENADDVQLACYHIHRKELERLSAGNYRLSVGRATIFCGITRDSATVYFGALHLGDHNIQIGVNYCHAVDSYKSMAKELISAFKSSDLPAVIRLLDKNFGNSTFSLKSLFKDEQRCIINSLVSAKTKELSVVYEDLFQDHYTLLRFLGDVGAPLPASLRGIAHAVLDSRFQKLLAAPFPDLAHFRELVADGRIWAYPFDAAEFSGAFQEALIRLTREFRLNPQDLDRLVLIEELVGMAKSLELKINFWQMQNEFFNTVQIVFPKGMKASSEGGLQPSELWLRKFQSLCAKLSIRIPK